MSVFLQDKQGRKLAEVKTEDEIIAASMAVGTIAAVVLKKPSGKQYSGYVKKADLDLMNVQTVQIPANFANMEAVDVPTRLREQYFDIYDIKEQDEYVEISARHSFYRMLKNNTLWKPTEDTQYTAAAVCRNVLSNAMFSTEFDVASDCTDTLPGKDFDYERKNLVECFLDPENGICKKFGLSMIRDNGAFYCLKNVGYNRGIEIQDGKNLLGVERQENTDGMATRVAPFGKTAKGEIVWLEHNGHRYIDSQYIDDYPTPYLELYDTGIQIGKDGVTEQNIQAKLLEAGQKRFTEDEVDKPEVTLTIEFISLGDTEEYAQYRGLDKVYLYDILTVRDQKRGYSYTAQVIGVEHDILTGRLLSVTIGSLKNADASRKIATWQVPEIDGANIRLLSIQAGAFEPGAIGEADLQEHIIKYAHFASATIDSLTADALTAVQAEIETLIAGHITADSIKTTAIAAINAKLGTATVTNGYIDNAYIGFLDVKAATAESLIARDAVTDRYFIDKLQVRNAQLVYATVGELVIKASNNRYYRLDIAADGSISPTEVTLTAAEIAAGVTSNGHASIIETDLTVQDLAASNMKAINALIDQLTAARIDVDELFARQAFIGKLNTTDITSNSYLQIMVNSKSKVYVQWETPTDGHNGDLWYKRAPQPIDEMEENMTAQLENYPLWAFDGYELYQMQNGAWVEIDDTAEIRETMSRLLLESDRIDLAILQIDSELDGKYTRMSGIEIVAQGVEVSGGTYVRIKSGGLFTVDSGNFAIDASGNVSMTGSVTAASGQIGGFSIGATRLSSGSSTTFVGLDSGTANCDYAIWAGAAEPASAPFRLKRDGTLTVTKLEILEEGSQSTTETIDLRNYALWKLNYGTVKTFSKSESGGSVTLTIGTTDGDKSVTFNRAATAHLVGGWSGNTYEVYADNDPNVLHVSTTVSFSPTSNTINTFSNHLAYATVSAPGVSGPLKMWTIDATSEYNQGWNAALAACGISGGGTVYTGTVRQLYDPDLDVYVNAVNPYTAHMVSAK